MCAPHTIDVGIKHVSIRASLTCREARVLYHRKWLLSPRLFSLTRENQHLKQDIHSQHDEV